MPPPDDEPGRRTVSDEADAVVIGAGINGLVAAAELAGAGWSVVLLDARDRLGGFIASDELTLPGHVHDTFSSWHPLFVGTARTPSSAGRCTSVAWSTPTRTAR